MYVERKCEVLTDSGEWEYPQVRRRQYEGKRQELAPMDNSFSASSWSCRAPRRFLAQGHGASEEWSHTDSFVHD